MAPDNTAPRQGSQVITEHEQAWNRADAFSHIAVHELREPLRVIQGIARLVREDYAQALGSHGGELVRRIEAAGARAEIMLQSLRDYTWLGRQQMPIRPVPLQPLFGEVIAQLPEELSSYKGCVHVPDALPTVLAHRPTLIQVVLNLITNALKFVEPGAAPSVRVFAEPGDTGVRLWICDNGIGIPAHQHQRIFEPFERLHAIDRYPGTGMGLAIVRRAVERMGCRVGLTSELGNGSCFWIEMNIGNEASA